MDEFILAVPALVLLLIVAVRVAWSLAVTRGPAAERLGAHCRREVRRLSHRRLVHWVNQQRSLQQSQASPSYATCDKNNRADNERAGKSPFESASASVRICAPFYLQVCLLTITSISIGQPIVARG